jgi:hypothetical protein
MELPLRKAEVHDFERFQGKSKVIANQKLE